MIARTKSRIEIVADHLKTRGHISEGTALVEYGRFRLSDVIYRLRSDRRDLLPAGMEIVTISKQDTQGNRYGEYTLVTTRSEASRRHVEGSRRLAASASPLQGNDAASI